MSRRLSTYAIHRLILLTVLLLLLAIVGYCSFVLYQRLFLPTSAGSGLILLAMMTGLALHALTIAYETAAFLAMVTAALAIALAMMVLAITIGFAQANVVRSMKPNSL